MGRADFLGLIESQSPLANSGILLLDHQTAHTAAGSCSSLGEALWNPKQGIESIRTQLEYLAYEGKYARDQLYRVASPNFGSHSITLDGFIATVPSDTALPALCTQTAPFSNLSYADTSSPWQLEVESNNDLLTGLVFLPA
jgi:hypothetical protein